MVASSHLQWSVERILLAIFNWNISKSKVSNSFLYSNINFNKKLKEYQKVLT